MIIRSTDIVSRVDDSENPVVEPDRAVLDWCAPGLLDLFPAALPYNSDGLLLSDGLTPASWLSAGSWPSYPCATLGLTQVRLSLATSEQTRGLALRHVLECDDGSLDETPSINRVLVLEGCVVVLRPTQLLLFDFASDDKIRFGFGSFSYGPTDPDRETGIYAATYEEAGDLLTGFSLMPVDMLWAHHPPGGQMILVGGEQALEVLVRLDDQTDFSAPWGLSPLLPIDITAEVADTFADTLFGIDGHLYLLLQRGEDALLVTRTLLPLNLADPLTPPASLFSPVLLELPAVMAQATAGSEVSSDPATRVRPRLAQAPTGELYILCAWGVAQVPRPQTQFLVYRWWLGLEGIETGLTPQAGYVIGDGHLVDLKFDGQVPGLLFRYNPDTSLTDDAELRLYDQGFVQVQWVRRYPAPSLGLRVHAPVQPRSSLVYVGLSASPPTGQSVDPELEA